MESPHNTKRKIHDASISIVDSSPRNTANSLLPGEEFSLYHLNGESSPNFRPGQDVLEVGWGDSPEPLKMEKFELTKTPVPCKKKLEPKESPKSSIAFKRRNIRTTLSLPSKSIVDVAKYVAEVQELSKNIMKQFDAKKLDENSNDGENLIRNTQFIERDFNITQSVSSDKPISDQHESKNSDINTQNIDPTFDNVLQDFINEEDDWLSQALSSQELTKTPYKGSFTKSKSENELSITKTLDFENKNLTQNCRNVNSFRRTSSFDMTKPNNSVCLNTCKNISEIKNTFNGISENINRYSQQEIERKRLEAKYRRERREIERKKLEALKKLELKKLRTIRT